MSVCQQSWYRAYCYAELAVSSLAMAVIIASTHFAYPRRDGQAELAWQHQQSAVFAVNTWPARNVCLECLLLLRPARCTLTLIHYTLNGQFIPTPVTPLQTTVAWWRSGNAVCRINAVALRRVRLVLGWVTVYRYEG